MPNSAAKLPNFFLVGAPRAGSTSLYHHLDQHPDIYMSPMKEINYFADEMRNENFDAAMQPDVKKNAEELRRYLDGPLQEKLFGGMVTEWGDYCRLFAGAREERAIGEASVNYLWSRSAAERIAACMPHAKILMVLRNPVELAYSQYLMVLNHHGMGWSFQEHIEAALAVRDEKKIGILYPFLETGLYAEQVLRYRQRFPVEQIGLWLYEERSAPGFPGEVYEFLGVDGGFVPDTSTRYLQQQIPKVQMPGLNGVLRQGRVRGALRRVVPASMRSSIQEMFYTRSGAMQMEPEARRLLINYYREDVGRLGEMLGRNLSGWLQ